MQTRWIRAVCGAAVLALAGCGEESPAASTRVPAAEAAPVVRAYVALVSANYGEMVTTAEALRTAVRAMLAAPSAQTLAAARQAWVAARVPYYQTEAYRFYGGPIDGPADNVEGRLNAWPLDENYLDYVTGVPMSGIIQNPTMYPSLARAQLVTLNERGGENNIATGWHAIEFLLWGQDTSVTGPGDRPHTDYVTGAGGTGGNVERRRQYLTEVTDQLVADLTAVRDQWNASSPNTYAARLIAGDSNVALRNMLRGMGALAGTELSGERLTVAYEERDQEDEHDCFSDNTHNGIVNDAAGIQNVWLGRYGSVDGPGLDDLVRARNPALADRVTRELQEAVDDARAIPAPFDQAILGADSAPGRVRIRATIDALRRNGRSIVEVAAALGLSITLDV
ncbi:MAG: imelysin family protein [Polyangiales bacterium]